MSCEKTNGCTGNCCTKFFLPFSYEEFQEMEKRETEGHRTFIDRNGKERIIPCIYEIAYIADMLIPLGLSNISVETGERHIDIIKKWPGWENVELTENTELDKGRFYKDGEVWANYFTCKHFNTEKKICNAYNQRPYLCRSFGNADPACRYKGCGIVADPIVQLECQKYDRERNEDYNLNHLNALNL
jgi:Fe-S-cluster containining protein